MSLEDADSVFPEVRYIRCERIAGVHEGREDRGLWDCMLKATGPGQLPYDGPHVQVEHVMIRQRQGRLQGGLRHPSFPLEDVFLGSSPTPGLALGMIEGKQKPETFQFLLSIGETMRCEQKGGRMMPYAPYTALVCKRGFEED